jgi:hypothetical protein
MTRPGVHSRKGKTMALNLSCGSPRGPEPGVSLPRGERASGDQDAWANGTTDDHRTG